MLGTTNDTKSMACCYDLNACVPPNSYVDRLIPKVNVVLVGELFGRWLSYEGEALMSGISAVIKETPLSSLSFSGYTEKVPAINKEEGPH